MNFRLSEFVEEETTQEEEQPEEQSHELGISIPTQPESIDDTGLNMGFLTDLVLKIIYFSGSITAQKIEETSKMPFLGVLDKVLDYLKMEEYVDIIGAEGGFSERSFQYVIARKGIEKVNEVLERNQYAGPAPVPLDDYVNMVKKQTLGQMIVDEATIRDAFAHLVVNKRITFDTSLPELGTPQRVNAYIEKIESFIVDKKVKVYKINITDIRSTHSFLDLLKTGTVINSSLEWEKLVRG